jgi:CitMHS family citrate transporter
MIDVGLFDPLIAAILRIVGNDPLKVVVGTALLATFVSLDGDGSTTYMITVAAMLPLYRRLRLDPLSLTCVTILANSVLNLTPWGGPLARVASALHVEPADVFVPLLPAMVAGIAGVLGLAWLLGRRERQRLGHLSLSAAAAEQASIADSALVPPQTNTDVTRKPRLLVFNALLTLALLVALVLGVLPLPVLFMVAFAIALLVNYPKVADQRERVAAHAKNVIAVVSLIFAAGIFTGILSGTGMLDAMAKSMLDIVPPALGPYLAPITALASLPFTFFVSNDAFYFGVIPIIAETASGFGISPGIADRSAGARPQPVGAFDVPAGRPRGRRVRRSPALHIEVGNSGLPADVGRVAHLWRVSTGNVASPAAVLNANAPAVTCCDRRTCRSRGPSSFLLPDRNGNGCRRRCARRRCRGRSGETSDTEASRPATRHA